MAKTPLQELADHGQSVWIDYLSRPFVQDGDLAGLVEQGVVGVTSNPTIFQGAIAEGDALRRPDPRDRLQRREASPRRSSSRSPPTTSATPATCCAPSTTRATARTATSRSRSTRTSRTTREAHDRGGQAPARPDRQARTCSSRSPPRKEGLPAIEETIAAGIPVNVTLIFSLERHREVAEAYVRGLQRLADSRRRPLQGRLRRVVLRLARRHRGRQAPRRDRRPRRAQGQARDRQRQARLPDLQGGLLGRAVGGAGGQGRHRAALPVGVDLDQEPRVPRRDLRRGARRPRHGQHDAARHRRGRARPRRDPRQPRGGRRRRPQGARRPRRPPGSTTTTSSRRSRRRACRSSPTPSRSCSPTSSPSATSSWPRDGRQGKRLPARARPAAAGRLVRSSRRRRLGPPDLLDVGRRPDGRPAGRPPAARLRRTRPTRPTTTWSSPRATPRRCTTRSSRRPARSTTRSS